jgi:hypothetical protein
MEERRQPDAATASARVTKKRTKVRAALAARARDSIGDDAVPLDYVCDYVAGGGLVSRLASDIATDIGEACSRSFLSLIIHRLAPDATARIAEAREQGGDALAEKALDLIEGIDLADAEQVENARLRISNLRWFLARSRGARSQADQGPQTPVSLGAMHIDALRRRNAASEVGLRVTGDNR